jgi:hypothetical protein
MRDKSHPLFAWGMWVRIGRREGSGTFDDESDTDYPAEET